MKVSSREILILKCQRILGIALVCILASSCGKWRKNHDDSDSPPLNQPAPPLADDPNQQTSNDRALRLRGFEEYSLVLGNSLMITPGTFAVNAYLGEQGDLDAIFELGSLMGFYSSDPLSTGWKNVSPNTVSTSIYLLAVSGFARHVAYLTCSEFGVPEAYGLLPFEIKPGLVHAIKNYCANGDSTSAEDLNEIWNRFTAEKSTPLEREFWIADLKEISTRPLNERLEFMFTTAAMTPELMFHQ